MPRVKKSELTQITLFKPSEVRVIDINTCLSGERNKANKLTEGVLHFYNYLIKKSLGHWDGEFGTHWIQVPYEYMRSFLTHSYLQQVDNLVRANLLEVKDWNSKDSKSKVRNWKAPVLCGNGLVKTGECKLYRIPQHLFGKKKKFTKEKLALSKQSMNKINAVNNSRSKSADEYRRYVCSMMQQIVLIDTPESREVIDKLFAKNQIRLNSEDYLDIFNYSPFNETLVDEFGIRVFGKIVFQPKAVRPFYRFIDDLESELVEIDLVNSQPAIFAAITPNLIKRFAPECGAAIPLFEAMEGNASYADFQLHCFNGTFYEELRDKYNDLFKDKLIAPVTRDEAKDVFYIAAYSNYDYYATLDLEVEEQVLRELVLMGLPTEKQAEKISNIRAHIAFESRFPAVYELFRSLKALKWGNVNPGKQYANNCLLAQRIESALIYTVLVKALKEAGINKLVTIHDAILVRKQDEYSANRVIQLALDNLRLPLKLKSKE